MSREGDDPELTEEAQRDLTDLGRVTRKAVGTLLRRLARGEAEARPRDTWLPDATVKEVELIGGLIVFFRPLRPRELLARDRTEPGLLIIRILTERDVVPWRERVARETAERAEDDREAGL